MRSACSRLSEVLVGIWLIGTLAGYACRLVCRRASGALLGRVGAMTMQKISSRVRVAMCAAAIAAFSIALFMPTPASARWYHRAWGWHPGWHWGWRGCCLGPRIVLGVIPPVVAVSPPVVYARPPGRFWVPPHWNGSYYVPGHWA